MVRGPVCRDHLCLQVGSSVSEKLPTSPQAEGLLKSARFDLPSSPPALGSEHPNQIRVLLPNDLLFLAHHCLIGTQSVLISSSCGEVLTAHLGSDPLLIQSKVAGVEPGGWKVAGFLKFCRFWDPLRLHLPTWYFHCAWHRIGAQ